MAKNPTHAGNTTFTEELQDIVRTLGPDAPQRTANEIQLHAMALRLLHMKHGGTWDDTPVFPATER